jgi:hypothetical protein
VCVEKVNVCECAWERVYVCVHKKYECVCMYGYKVCASICVSECMCM